MPDVPDMRDFKFTPKATTLAKLPPAFDLSNDPSMPPIYDQGELGSCTAQAIAAAIQFERRDAITKEDFIPSRLFIYYNERAMEGTIGVDAGAQIRDGIKSVALLGACRENRWPYDINKFTKKPTKTCYKDGIKFAAVQYHRAPRDLSTFKAAIFDRNLIVIGIAVYESFMSEETARTGIVKMPSCNEKMLGGHAVAVVGYNDETQCFIVRNSWGENWGNAGFFHLPYDFITNSDLSDDFWVITRIRS